jgi:glutathionylspermidine synthase
MTDTQTFSLRATDAIPAGDFARIRRHMALDHFKWDPQVGDRCALAPFALILDAQQWALLRSAATRLAAELTAAEEELLRRPDLWQSLALPCPLQKLLQHNPRTPAAPRSLRFDFHPTSAGWKLSEVNSDVPGGYTESSHLPRLMAKQLQGTGLQPAGDPLQAWTRALACHTHRGRIALVCAPGYMEDRQILACLAAGLRQQGCDPHIVDLSELRWTNGRAAIRDTPLDAIIRFYQSEWLAALPRRAGWQSLFVNGQTPVANPPAAALSESKGLPLIWDRLPTRLDTWRQFLPETRGPRTAHWRNSADWVLKSKYSNNGDSVFFPDALDRRALGKLRRELWWNPNQWVAQKRFAITPLDTPLGPMHPCLGVYIINGRPAGIYGRLSHRAIIDYAAIDVAVLIEGAAE